MKIPRRAIAAVEAGESSVNDHNVRLLEFYESKGIEFLGELTFGKDVARSGARWIAPEKIDFIESEEYHTEKTGVSFAAARNLLGLKQAEAEARSGVSLNAIGKLETGQPWPSSLEKLHKFYLNSGVEFLGWSSVRTQLFYGVGVRWRS
ncbi:helix-turn-helix transcriptional regulator [Rhizobium sp. Root1220]|uniref:helix-turn-helix domain-containing protein n=1 Tax=Rhizobium sp. Root1220 TaxID=1736432 RepID=UPI00138F6414|nr:helix-turn-helix transcriptional regulator [Rhizobium sp. Root1220]